MLVGGVLSPMLEVEVRVTKIDATLLGTPIEFQRPVALLPQQDRARGVSDTDPHGPAGDDAGWRAGDPVQRGLPDAEDAGARRRVSSGLRCCAPTASSSCWLSSYPSGPWPTSWSSRSSCPLSPSTASSAARSDGLRNLPERPTGADPDECFQDPAWLLLVHWFLRREHHPVEKAGARDRFQFRFRIKLARPSMLRARRVDLPILFFFSHRPCDHEPLPKAFTVSQFHSFCEAARAFA